MPTSSIVPIDTALTESTDYEVVATIVGPDGTTGVEPTAIQTLTAKLVNLEPGGGVLFSGRDVKSYAGAAGAFVMPLLYSDLILSGTARMQKRLLILELVQTNGKRRVLPVAFSVENVPGFN